MNKNTVVFIIVLIMALMTASCKKNSPASPVEATPTMSMATQTAIALLTAGPSAQATATARAQQTANAQSTLTAMATLFTATTTPTITPTTGPITIDAQLDGNDQSDGMEGYGYVYVRDSNNNSITNAVVTFRDITNATRVNVPLYGGNYYRFEYAGFVPGSVYEIDVFVNGVTYTAASALPGPAQLDPEGNLLSWQHGGNYNFIFIDDPSNQGIYSQSDSGTISSRSVDISSVYSVSGQYGKFGVNVNLQNYAYGNTVFAGASSNSSIELTYRCSWDVFVTAGSQVAGTPTPINTPSLLINANWQAGKSSGAITATGYTEVRNSNYWQVSNATVTVRDLTNLTLFTSAYNGSNYGVQNPVYVPGDNYEFDVFFNGITYSASCKAPGRWISPLIAIPFYFKIAGMKTM